MPHSLPAYSLVSHPLYTRSYGLNAEAGRSPKSIGGDLEQVRDMRRQTATDVPLDATTVIWGYDGTRLVMGALDDPCLNVKLTPLLQPVLGQGFPMQAWREPKPPTEPIPQDVLPGYIATPPSRGESDSLMAMKLARYELDLWRDRQDDFLDATTLRLNTKGLYERDNFSVLYRVDSRSPQALLTSNGFGPSRVVSGIEPMIEQDVLITSASLRASNIVLYNSAIPSVAQARGVVYQYAIDPQGVTAASWLENFRELTHRAAVKGISFELSLDETHADAGAVDAERIYIIGADDRAVEARLATMRREGFGNTFGVSLRDYVTYAWQRPAVQVTTASTHGTSGGRPAGPPLDADRAWRVGQWLAASPDRPDPLRPWLTDPWGQRV